MLTDEQLEIISDVIKPLFEYLENQVIVDIARRIKATLEYTRTAELEAEHLYSLGYSPSKIRSEAMKILNADAEYRKEVAKNTLEHKRYVKNILNKIEKKAYLTGKDLISTSAEMAWNVDLSLWKKKSQQNLDKSFLPQLVEAFSKQTNTTMKNLTQSSGFKLMSGYESIETVYRKELDKAVIKVCSGAFTREKVVSDIVKDLSHSGLRSIDYANGYSMQIDTAVKNAVRTGCHQVRLKVADERIMQSGTNLVYVFAHEGARNTGVGVANHEEWQGKVYYLKKTDSDYVKEAKRVGQSKIDDMWEKTGYSVLGDHANDPLGLNGYNCRHYYSEWNEGVSQLPAKVEQRTDKYTINGKEYDYYALTQKQRLLERQVRELKREKEARVVLKMDYKDINAKIKQKTREYEDLCERCDLKNKSNNMRYEFGSSDIAKTKTYEQYMKMVHDTENN